MRDKRIFYQSLSTAFLHAERV